MITIQQLAVITAGVSLGYITFGIYIRRWYQEIGVWSLAIFSTIWGFNFLASSVTFYLLGKYGVTDGAQLQSLTAPIVIQQVLIGVSLLSSLLIISGIFVWLWFVLRYTRRISPQEKIGLALLAGASFLVAALNGGIGAASTFGIIEVRPGVRTSFHSVASVIEVLGTGVAVGVGVGLLYTTAEQHRPFQRRTVIGLSAAIVLPWLVRYIYQFSLVTGFWSINVLRSGSLLVGLFGLFISVRSDGLFEQLPASRSIGRQTAFDASDTAIVVVNSNGNVSDLNAAAIELFGVTPSTAIGHPLEKLLPDSVNIDKVSSSSPDTFQLPNSDTVVEATGTKTTDDTERSIGRTIVFTDITDQRRRQQRIQVLNRVLRHNLRNDINAARGYIGLIQTDDPDGEDHTARAESILNDLIKVGNKARETEEILAADPFVDSSIQLRPMVESIVETPKIRQDEAIVSIEVPENVRIQINPAVLKPVVRELITNAIRHTNSTEIIVSYDTDEETLTVTDMGPGIPEHEIKVLDAARETSLKHSSGLGLWLVRWGTDLFGGTLVFDTDGSGSQVRIELPSSAVAEK